MSRTPDMEVSQIQPFDLNRKYLSPVYEETSGYTTEGTIATNGSGGSLQLPPSMSHNYHGRNTKFHPLKEQSHSTPSAKVSAFSSLGELKSLVQKREKIHLVRVSMGDDDMELLGVDTKDGDEEFEEASNCRQSGDSKGFTKEGQDSVTQIGEGTGTETSEVLTPLSRKEIMMNAKKQHSQRMKKVFLSIKRISVRRAARKVWKKVKPMLIGKKRVHKNRGVKFEKSPGFLA